MLGRFMMSIPEARKLLEPGFGTAARHGKGLLKYGIRSRRRRQLGGATRI